MDTTDSDLHERLTRAFIDVFAANVPFFGGGGPRHYGVRLENISIEGSQLDLILTFRSAVRYCCFEFACHFAHYGTRGWSRLRDAMDRHGLNGLPLPVIRKVRAVIEPGAVATPSPQGPAFRMEGSEYEAGPFHPAAEDETAPDR